MFQQRRMRYLPDIFSNFWTDRRDKQNAQSIAPFFDTSYYLAANPDVRKSGLDARIHYVKYGWKEGRDPSPSFSTSKYLAANRDLINPLENPLLHFIKSGGTTHTSTTPSASEDEIKIVKTEFDTNYYLRNYPEVSNSDLDPENYFCVRGWRQGHNPSSSFSTNHYLTTNPDVRESGINPYWHYLVAGRDEGRSPKSLVGWQQSTIATLQPLKKIRQDCLVSDDPPHILSVQELSKLFAASLNCRRLLISIGHDDYRSNPGGVQLCIGLEAKMAQSLDIDYLNLHPWQTFIMLADEDSDPVLCLVLNGNTLGYARISKITSALSTIDARNAFLVFHHLAGHSIEKLIELAQSIDLTGCFYWLHDYFSICTSFALQRNGVADCGAPNQNSNSCTLCIYGEERRRQARRFNDLFDALEIELISPSKIALEIWRKRGNLVSRTERVHPHITLRRKRKRNTASQIYPERCRIAFVGSPEPHKGWPVFQELRSRLANDDRYQFWHFGTTDCGDPELKHVPTHSHASDPTCTTDKLKENQVDLVIHWANSQETFSFTAYEAITAGAFVITNAGSGNVAVAVRNRKSGRVLNNVEELYALADSGELLALAKASRDARSSSETIATSSGFTLDILADHLGQA